MTQPSSDLQTSTTGDASQDAPPVAVSMYETIREVQDADADLAADVAEVMSAAPETLSVDSTAVHSPESTLPSQAIVARRGRPHDAPPVLIEGAEDSNETKKYLGSDGNFHVEVPRARAAFEDYLNMGASRSLARLASKYFQEKSPGWELNESEPAILRKLSEYSANLDWQNRIRLRLARQSALAVTNAQKQAARNRTERLRRSQKLQDIAEAIFDRADILGSDVESLPPEVARQLVKPAIQMMEIGMIQERLEAGESLERIKPPKPIDQMDEAELDEYIDLLRSER